MVLVARFHRYEGKLVLIGCESGRIWRLSNKIREIALIAINAIERWKVR